MILLLMLALVMIDEALTAPTAERRLAAWVVLPAVLGFAVVFAVGVVRSRGRRWL